MKKIIIIFAIAATALSLYANTHKNHRLSKETKIIAITILAEARGEKQSGMYAVGAVNYWCAGRCTKYPQELVCHFSYLLLLFCEILFQF